MLLIYLIGEPGVGKTTLADELMAPWGEGEWLSRPLKRVVHRGRDAELTELGWPRHRHVPGAFGGTDSLSMSIQPVARSFLTTCSSDVVFGEGDRLANDKFFAFARSIHVGLSVICLSVPAPVAAARRAARGSKQNEAWLKGRCTKVAGLASRWSAYRLNGRDAPPALAEEVRMLWPELRP